MLDSSNHSNIAFLQKQSTCIGQPLVISCKKQKTRSSGNMPCILGYKCALCCRGDTSIDVQYIHNHTLPVTKSPVRATIPCCDLYHIAYYIGIIDVFKGPWWNDRLCRMPVGTRLGSGAFGTAYHTKTGTLTKNVNVSGRSYLARAQGIPRANSLRGIPPG